MKWFEGDIPAAIQLAKSQKTLFIVFVTGDDEPSKEAAKLWDEEEISQLSAVNNCVALKLDSKSQLGTQFAQIYPVMVIPSVFFIAPETGLPLEVSMGQVLTDQLLEKFNKALQMQQTVAPSLSLPSTAVASTPTASAVANADDALGATGGNASDMSSGEDREFHDNADDLIPGETLEERKERTLKKMAERREQKDKDADDKKKKEEMERRKLGQETQKFHQWKAEMEKKEFENSYKKEKEEQKRALEKVRADLESDRQERAVKYRREKEQQQEANERAKKAKVDSEAKRLEKENAVKRESSRVQFRLPDGSSVTQIFAASDSLLVARNFIQQRLNVSSIILSTTFPKRTFTGSDMDRTLLDLDLVPSSVLIVLIEGSRSGHMTSSLAADRSFLWMILAPLIALWNFIYAFLFPPAPARAGNQIPERSGNRTGGSTGNDRSGSPDQRSSSGAPQGLRSRKFGNINRLSADDEDDESATWNGNSTQQM